VAIYNSIFWIFSVILVASALRVITARNPVHAVLFLVLTFFTCSVLWILLEAEFLAIILILVYVGAVMVLFLFVIMMLDINIAPLREGFIRNLPVGIFVGLVMVGEMAVIILRGNFSQESFPSPVAKGPDYSNSESIGREMYTDYLFHVEVAALILLVAIIAAVSLTMRKRPDTKYQSPMQQVSVKKEDRLRIVKMKSEKQ
jgi:NADH-quinone oxidoreductase subunit J